MKIDMVTVDDWFVLVIDGEKVDEGHRLSGRQVFENLVDVLKNEKKYPAGIGSLTFKETYLEDYDDSNVQEVIDSAVDRILRDWEVQKTLRMMFELAQNGLVAFNNGYVPKWNEYPYGLLCKMNLLVGDPETKTYTFTPHGKDVVEYIEKKQFSKRKTNG